jgi:hypothetical protein
LVYAIVLDIHVTSAPAQNVFPAPDRTTARNAASEAASAAQAARSRIISALNAFLTSGRFSVRYSTGPRRSTSRCW